MLTKHSKFERWLTSHSQEFIQLPVIRSPDNSSQTVKYLTRSIDDYGTLLCYASNSIGHQSKPCVAHIIPSGPPDPVEECVAGEPDPFQISVVCRSGYDGGLTSSYTAELYTDPGHTVLQSTVTNTKPEFSVYNLPPGTRWVDTTTIRCLQRNIPAQASVN